jgi:hypothetical protein
MAYCRKDTAAFRFTLAQCKSGVICAIGSTYKQNVCMCQREDFLNKIRLYWSVMMWI